MEQIVCRKDAVKMHSRHDVTQIIITLCSDTLVSVVVQLLKQNACGQPRVACDVGIIPLLGQVAVVVME